MTLLIRRADLVTMTDRGRFTGDVLICDGRIERIGESIPDRERFSIREIDATGLTLVPGFVDCCVRSGGVDDAWLREMALESGVLTALTLPDKSGLCSMMDADDVTQAPIRLIEAQQMTDLRLAQSLKVCAARGERPFMPIHTNRLLCRVLDALPAYCNAILTGVPAENTHLLSGRNASVIIGVKRGDDRPWRLARTLDEAGIDFAISCFYPAAKMKLLPVCAGLAAREGLHREKALSAITSGAAALLGMTDRGCIKEGCRADLLLLTGDPLLLSTERVLTIAGGRIRGTAAQSMLT